MGKLDNTLVQEFCRAYQIDMDYPADISEEKKKEIDAVFESSYGYKFELWQKTPESVRGYYLGRVPIEVLDAVSRCDESTLRELSINPSMTKTEIEQYQRDGEHKNSSYPSEVVHNTATFAAALAVGYILADAAELSKNRSLREALSDKAEKGILTDEEKRLWRQSRISDRDTILRHKAEHQPERILMYLLNKHRLGEIDNEKLMPMLADIIQKIETQGRQPELEKLLAKPRYQHMTTLFDEGTREILESVRQKDFSLLKNSNINFQAWGNVDLPADIARFRDNQLKQHARLQQSSLSKQEVLNYIYLMRQKQRN